MNAPASEAAESAMSNDPTKETTAGRDPWKATARLDRSRRQLDAMERPYSISMALVLVGIGVLAVCALLGLSMVWVTIPLLGAIGSGIYMILVWELTK